MGISAFFFLIFTSFQSQALAADNYLNCELTELDKQKIVFYEKFINYISISTDDKIGQNLVNFTDFDGNHKSMTSFEFVKYQADQIRAVLQPCQGSGKKHDIFLDGRLQKLKESETAAYKNVIKLRENVIARSLPPHNTDIEIQQMDDFLKKNDNLEGLGTKHIELLKQRVRFAKEVTKQTTSWMNNPKTCSYKDYRSQLPPVRAQADAGLCFAYTAADLASFASKKNISPLGVAIAAAKKRHKLAEPTALAHYDSPMDFSKGGNIVEAFKAAKKQGFCLDENFGKSTRSGAPFSGDMSRSKSEANAQFDLLKEVAAMTSASDLEQRIQKLTQDQKNSCSLQPNRFKQLFPTVQATELAEVLKASNPRDAIYDFYDHFCAPERVKVEVYAYDTSYNAGEKQILVDLFSELDKDRIAGIYYYDGMTKTSRGETGTTNHGSSVVGRRFNEETGTCELLIRNSWDVGCKQYAVFGESYSCEAGSIWIPAEVVQDHTTGIAHITD